MSKKFILLSLFSLSGMLLFAAFPVETTILLDKPAPQGFQLDWLAFLLGILTFWLLPYSLLLLFIKKKNFRGSLAWGWLAGLLLVLGIVIYLLSGVDFSNMTVY
jgi:hypothetical protein